MKFLHALALAFLFVPFGGAAIAEGLRGHDAWAALWVFCLIAQIYFLAKFYEAVRKPTPPVRDVMAERLGIHPVRISGNAKDRRKARRAISRCLDSTGVGESTGSQNSGPVIRGGAR